MIRYSCFYALYNIFAPIDGIIKEIKVVIGQTVEVDTILAVIE